jgi:hypothetical protein
MQGPYDDCGKKANEINAYDVFGSHSTPWGLKTFADQAVALDDHLYRGVGPIPTATSPA